MDCRKWAPRSNLWKYYYFVKGMSKFLPKSFVEYFFKFWTKMFTKRIRIQKHFIENLLTNEGYSHILEYLNVRSDGDFELIMPYSFMMGIFNYLSSLMHAASQMYFCDNIASEYGSSCNFLAHSDDSAGIITSRTYEKCLKTYDLYEKFQRSLNHLMSKKKCCLSKRSFEIISIMYCDKRFIPMTHKFLTNCSFDPKGGGWYDDVSSITGKVIDLYNNGGTYVQCYGLMLACSELLRKAYHLPRSELGSQIPLPFGGTPNYHPIHMVLVGSISQECLLDLVEDPKTRRARIQAYISVVGDYIIGNTEKLKYALPYIKMPRDMIKVDQNNKDLLSAVASLPYKSTFISYAKHVNKLYDRKYVYSLTGFDSDQLALSTLFYPCMITMPDGKHVSLSRFSSAYQTVYLTGAVDSKLDLQYPIGNYLSYFKQVESMKIDLDTFSIESTKSCKPVLYNTIENFSLKISQENLMILSAIEKDGRIAKIHESKEKFKFLKRYLLASLPGSDEEKDRFLRNFDPSEKEDRVRSGYLFMPGQVKIDTPSRFFTYSMLYTTRRYLVSKLKPQLFTPAEFSLENQGLEEFKHQYLCFKLLESGSNFTFEDCKKTISNCAICSKNDACIQDLEQYNELLNHKEMADVNVYLPFVDYHKTQYRGKNVWFAGSDFTLYTPFGKVTSVTYEDNIWTTWEVYDSNYLQPIWQLYKMFCISRGIDYERPGYQDTGFSAPKMAFNDFNTPYIPNLFSFGMVLSHSKVILGDVEMPKLHRKGLKFYLSDRVVDFKIYSIYDISHTFYEKHNLETIKNHVYRTDLKVDEETLIKLFSNSKIYKVLLQDPRHSSDTRDKYSRNGYLGNPGSFTRALALSDEAGILRYRSSYNHVYLNKGVIEFDTVEGVPVLDMFEKVNYSRMNHFEKTSFEKAMAGYPLTSVDRQNLINIRKRIGLEALGTAIVLHKHVFENMLAASVVSIPKPILTDVFKGMVDAISQCMKTYPDNKVRNQFEGSKRSWWSLCKGIINNASDRGFLPFLMSQGLLRAKSDNPHKFWSIISDNVLLSSLTINQRYYTNLVSMLRGILISLKEDFKYIFEDEDKTPKYRDYALTSYKAPILEGSRDMVIDVLIAEGEPYILNEESLDGVTGGDDIEDFEDDIRDRRFSSKWKPFSDDEDDDSEESDASSMSKGSSGDQDIVKEYKMICDRDMAVAMQDTALHDYEQIILLAPHEHVCFPWLGKGDYDRVTQDGITWYRSIFPGEEDFKGQDYNKVDKLKPKSFNELTKVGNVDVEEMRFKYLPGSLKSIDEARSILSDLGIFDKKIVDAIFPNKQSLDSLIEFYFDKHRLFFEDMTSFDLNVRRRSKKFFLPGFQGVLEDSQTIAEAKAIFGENCYSLFSGNVRLTQHTYSYFMRVLKRFYRDANLNDKALIMFLISTLIDTTIEAESDQWYVECLTKYCNDIDIRLYPEDDYVMFPVAPGNSDEIVYTELDIFE